MRQAFFSAIGLGERFEPLGVTCHCFIIVDLDGPFFQKKRFVFLAFRQIIEFAIEHDIFRMKGTCHLYGLFYLVRVMRIKQRRIRDEVRNLPAFVGVLENERVVNANAFRQLLRGNFGLAIDHFLGTNAWVAVDIFA